MLLYYITASIVGISSLFSKNVFLFFCQAGVLLWSILILIREACLAYVIYYSGSESTEAILKGQIRNLLFVLIAVYFAERMLDSYPEVFGRG
jgi:hypothetical protein